MRKVHKTLSVTQRLLRMLLKLRSRVLMTIASFLQRLVTRNVRPRLLAPLVELFEWYAIPFPCKAAEMRAAYYAR